MSEGNGRKPPLRGYDRLWIFRRSLAALNAVFELSEKFPEKEAEKLTHPIRQSAFWVSLFIIRAWVRRRKVRQALKDLREASRKALYISLKVGQARELGYISERQYDRIHKLYFGLAFRLAGITREPKLWKRLVMRFETPADKE